MNDVDEMNFKSGKSCVDENDALMSLGNLFNQFNCVVIVGNAIVCMNLDCHSIDILIRT